MSDKSIGAIGASPDAHPNLEDVVNPKTTGKVVSVEKKNDDKKEEKEKATLSNFFRILGFGTALDYFLMSMTVLMAVISGAAMPLMFLVFGRLIGDFAGYFTPGSDVTRAQFEHQFNQNSLYLVYIFVGRFASSYISMLCARISGLRISARLRRIYLEALFNQPVDIIDKISPGKVSTRITTSSNTIQLGISQQFALFIQSNAFTYGLYILAFVKSPLLTLVASASLPLICITYMSMLPSFTRIHKNTEDIREEASALAYEIFTSIRIVAAFGAEDRLHARHEKLLQKAKATFSKAGPLMGLMMSPMFFSNYATFALAFWFGIKQYIHGHISGIGDITVVLFSVVMAVGSLGRVWAPIVAMSKAASASTELFATIDSQPPDTTGLKGVQVPTDADLVFEDVRFAYPNRKDIQILDGINCSFEAGKVTAIVGPSGSGKSTIIGLVERWYDLTAKYPPRNEKRLKWEAKAEANRKKQEEKESGRRKKKFQTKLHNSPIDAGDSTMDEGATTTAKTGGRIRIGGINLAETDAKWWRSQIGLVQQEPFLFNDTIYQNVAFGLCGTKWQDADTQTKRKMVETACREAYADEFIMKLPLGFETIVGESGIKLSGGQRQRLAIARSIVKNPAILCLDEATSAIDVRTERVVQAALDRVATNRTTIVIAHRLSTIKKADKIIVLRSGKVAEQGTHEELLQNEGGVYHGLVHAQTLSMGRDTLSEDAELDVNIAAGADERAKAAAGINTAPVGSQSFADKQVGSARQLGILRSIWLIVKEQRRHLILYSVVSLGAMGAGAVYPIEAYIFAKLINAFTLTGRSLEHIGNFWALMFFVVAIGVGISYFVLGWGSFIVGITVGTVYRSESLSNILAKRIIFFDSEGNSPGSLTSRLSDDPHQLEQLTGTENSFATISVFSLIGCIIISFCYGWKLSLVSVFTALPVILLAGYFRVRLEMQFEKLNAAIFAESSQFGTEAVGAFRTVRSLIMEDVITDRYATLLRTHVNRAWRKAIPNTVIFAASDSIDSLCQALIFWYGGKLLASHEYNLVSFFVIYMAIVQGSIAAGIWFSFAPNLAQSAAATNRILSLRPRRADLELEPHTAPESQDKQAVGIEFKDVHFTYKSRNIPVLTGLNLDIKPGQFAALVGASGCGKSTTISLLERFYDPDSGLILCSGQDITSLNTSSYRSMISLVAQESTLYEGTIRENVMLSVHEVDATDDAIEAACQAAQIHDFIASLPEGYSTNIGPKGLQLSGGQRQRLALARALLRRPRCLLLDEATSSLDSESEKLVQQAIERAAGQGGMTIIAVAHRLATIQNADVIFVLGSGSVLEKGNHEELLRLKGVYYQMCQAQALDR